MYAIRSYYVLGNDYTGDEKTVIDYYSGLDSFDASDNTTAYVFAIGSTINSYNFV